MSESTEEKTEDPTDKKLEESSEEGQSFKFKEIIYLFNVICVTASLYFLDIVSIVNQSLDNLGNIEFLRRYLEIVKGNIALAFIIPISVSIVSVCLPSLMQTRFVLATKAIKFDFDKLNPVTGFKNLFSMKTILELIKSIVVHIAGIIVLMLWFAYIGSSLFEMIYLYKADIFSVLLNYIIVFVILIMLCIFIATTPFIYFEHMQYIKDLRMTKQEIKREQKDQNGNPEIKSRRTEIHRSLISDKDEGDVKKSTVILANPTHLAIGIYFDMEMSPIPFVSIKHKGAKAMEVFKIAQENNVPIIRNKKLTREIYKSNDRYTLIINDNLIKVLYLIHWLQNIEYKLPIYDERDVDVW